MALSKSKLKRWGPKALRALTEQIEKEINDRSPIPGLGIYINETPNGRQISTHPSPGAKTAENPVADEHPFQVVSNDPFELSLVPGVIETTMPTLGSIAVLSSDLAVLSAGAGVTKLVVKIDFDYDFDLGRYFITAADIDVYTIPDPPLTWNDPSEKESGTVYMRVADVTLNVDGAITDTIEYLDDNVRVFAIVGKEAFLF